jgi:hypothetical protein
MSAFNPQYGANQAVAPAAASVSIAIDPTCQAVRLVNSGANICHVRIGTGAQTATAADVPVRAGSEVVLRKGFGEDTLAHISALGTTLHVQTGNGGE